MKSTPMLTAAAVISLFAAACSSSGSNSNGAGAASFKVEVASGAAAGSPVAVTVTALNPAGARQPGYRGSITLSTDDVAATLPGTVSFGSSAQGTVTTSITFKGAGVHVVTATDAASATGSTQVTVQAGAPHLVLTLPADLNAGVQATANMAAVDAFGNAATSYAGTVNLASSDASATLPTSVTLAGGHGSFAVTFATVGSQTVTATDGATASITGGAAVHVHGLVYTDPPAQLASAVRLVLNPAASNARVVQLDLVANRTVPSGFAVGLNLPADPGRIALASTPLVEGNVFDPGAAPKAEAISLRADVLYSGLSQKAGGAGGGARDVAVPAGASTTRSGSR